MCSIHILKTRPITNRTFLLAGIKKTFLFAAPLFRRVDWFNFCFYFILFRVFLLFVMMCHIIHLLNNLLLLTLHLLGSKYNHLAHQLKKPRENNTISNTLHSFKIQNEYRVKPSQSWRGNHRSSYWSNSLFIGLNDDFDHFFTYLYTPCLFSTPQIGRAHV